MFGRVFVLIVHLYVSYGHVTLGHFFSSVRGWLRLLLVAHPRLFFLPFCLRVWMDEIQRTTETRREPSLLRALFRLFGWKYILFSVLLIIEVCNNVTKSPFCIKI